MAIQVNGKQVETFNFSGGECHVKISPEDIGAKTTIKANLKSSDDVMSLLLVVDAIRRVKNHTAIHLTLYYFPYARQDRVCNPGEALSVKVMADLINGLQCTSVTVYDPHSDVTTAILNNCSVVSLAEILFNTSLGNFIRENKLTLISPDAGAQKKTYAAAKMLSPSPEVLTASKIRDTVTGNITATYLHGEVANKNLMILDDICDGGRTFVELAKLLKDMRANDIYLYVTHGIFSKGLAVLKEHIKHIYCFHTMLKSDQIDPNFLTILEGEKNVF